MAKYIKNNSGVVDTWSGQELTNGQIYQLNFEDNLRFTADSRVVGGKIETDIASGSLQVSQDNFTTTLNPSDAIDLIRSSDAGCIQQVYVDDSAKADGLALKYDSASGKIIYGSVGGTASDMPAVLVSRTTTFNIPATWGVVTFDQADLENDIASLERDDTNTSRILIKTTGLHLVSLNSVFDNTSNLVRSPQMRLIINGTTVKGQIDFSTTKSANDTANPSMPVELTAGDYVEVEMQDADTAVNIIPGCMLSVIKLTGVAGTTGAAGIAGADGDITWQGNWVSQNYTANQAVKYTNGNSYVCKLDTVSSEVPTNATYWDILAEKGDAGSAQSRIDISVHPHNDDKKSTASDTYVSEAKFIWGGSTLLGNPAKIYANSFQDSSGSGNVRIYDVTNSQTIATSASISSTSEGNIVDLGTISNISAGQAVWEIQHKGDGTNTNNISSVSVEF